MNALEKALSELREARKSATLANASFAFPDVRILVEKKELHPDEYIKTRVQLHHETWIISPIDRAIAIIQAQHELIQTLSAIEKVLPSWKMARLIENLQAGER